MAATLTPDGELTYFSFPIEKSVEDENGDLVVYGKATDGTVDSDQQIVDPDWSAKAIREWLDTGGNLRVQHQARRDPAGKGLEVDITPDGHFVKALVVEPVAKNLVRKGVLQDFSIGVAYPDINPDPSGKAMNGIITGRRDGKTKISEISLVDRGSNFNSKFQLVKSADDGAPEFIGKMFGEDYPTEVEDVESIEVDSITKAAGDTVTLADIPDDVSMSFKPSDLAKLLVHKATAVGTEKRKMDPNVGGGVDRDKISAEDFAGRDRSFPIVTPGDVSDAASSIGRAGADNYSSEKLKKNIIRIARRKGDSFVKELPESWKKELGMSDSEKVEDTELAKKKKGKPFGDKGAPPFGSKDDDDSSKDDADEKDDAEKVADLVLGGEESADNKSLTVVDVEKVTTVEKKDKVLCSDCGANVHDDHKFCPECGGNLKGALPIQKNHDYTCLDCGRQLDKGEKFCPGCGKKNPGHLPEADSKIDESKTVVPTVEKVKKAKKAKVEKDHCPSPADGVEEAASTEPTPTHREPDGPAVEEFEKDAAMTEGDEGSELSAAKMIVPGDLEASASMRLKSLGVPTDLGTLHDLTCPCFHPDDVAKSYPNYELGNLNAAHWQAKAFDMAASAPLDQARKANQLWQHVVTLKNTDPRYVSEIRSDLYKEFADANPGPGSFPNPGTISARQFNHPIVTAGHEAPSPGHSGPNTSPASFGQISAADYGRDFLTAGHASEAPQNARAQMQPVSVPSTTGVPTRTYYTNAQRENARQAMVAMHDHIAQTFPDLCPAYTAAGPYQSQDLPGARPVPVGVGMPAPHVGGATKVKKSKKVKNQVETVTTEKAAPTEVTKATTLNLDVVQDLIDKAVAEANASRDEEISSLQKRLKKTNKLLEVVAAQPDPNGPYRGAAFDQIQKSSVAPEVLPSVSRAERTQENLFQALHYQWRNDPDPMQREVAWRELTKMSGINNNTLHK